MATQNVVRMPAAEHAAKTFTVPVHDRPGHFRVDWSGRSIDYSDEEIQAVVDVMRTADPFTQGPHLAKFEADFRAYLGVDHAFATANCTNAIDLVAVLAGLRPGDEVVAPAHTFCASVIPFLRRGVKLVWADIDPRTRLATRRTIEKVITPRTKLIAVVHLYGLMTDIRDIMELAEQRGILVMEDCAQAIGAEDHGRRSGIFGDFAVFSFHGQKSLTTLGEGGMLVVRDPAHARHVPGLRHNGATPYDRPDDRYWIPAMVNIDADIEGEVPFNFCLGEAQCAVGSRVLARLDRMNDDRIRRAEKFKAAVADFPELTFQEVVPGRKHVYHLLTACYEPPIALVTRDHFIARMAFTHAIKVVVQYYPLYRYPLFQKLDCADGSCPETDRYFDRMVSFPFHHWMAEEDFDYMIDCTRETLITLRRGVPR